MAGHRSSVKKEHKKFKSRHATKGSLKTKSKGKIEKDSGTIKAERKPTLAEKAQAGAKQLRSNRRNTAKQLKINKNVNVNLHRKLFEGRHGAPKIVAVIGLSPDVNPSEVVVQLNQSVEAVASGPVPASGMVDVTIERFKQKMKYIIPSRNFIEILDAARVADFVIFVLSPVTEVDSFGELCIRSIESQGVSNCIPVVNGLNAQVEGAKQQAGVRTSLLSFFSHFFPTTEKIYAPEVDSEALILSRILSQKFPQGVNWRDSRPYLLADDVSFDANTQTLAVEGTLRGQGLNADRLVHIPEYGDFQIDRVEAIGTFKFGASAMETENEVLAVPSDKQESLDELLPVNGNDLDMEEDEEDDDEERAGVRIDGHQYINHRPLFGADDEEEDDEDSKPKRRLPKGMSEYHASWIMDDEELFQSGDEEASEDEEEETRAGDMDMDEDVESNGGVGFEDAPSGKRVTFSEYAPTEGGGDTGTEMHVELEDDEEARQLQEYRSRAKDDLDFPDEIEVHPNESAKERLTRYRGVKNIRTCEWDVDERDSRAPLEWKRMARVYNFRATKNRVLKEAIAEAQVQPGTKVRLHLRAPEYILKSYNPARPFVVFGLLHHEHQLSTMNLTINPSSEYDLDKMPVASKSNLIVQCGPRRMVIRPLFSQAGANSANNVYKYERFLQPGRQSTATILAPLTFGNVPVIYFKDNGSPLPDLVGTGSVQEANFNRILVKRIVLTGHPFKIHKRLVTIRYMFFNREDIMWFKENPLFTKHGRSGFIKESLGTHGYFKATFDGRITSQDTVAMSLYKRVWPRMSTNWVPR
ncbi:ribosome biogenesis protein Tsr1p [Trichomonascus vanleenenianus]|uniref:small subunit rRNA maturation protein TSR1 n=1 Tax=Trichomonascus vanleenenianus TaxID=2268995 RepID=UPI003EC9BD99